MICHRDVPGIFAVALLAVGVRMSAPQASVISDSCDAHSNSRIPRFRIARNFENATARGRIIKLSIAPEEVTQDKLISLVCKLGRDYANEQVLVIWILNNSRAAQRFNPQGEGNDTPADLAMRASYSFSREENDQALTWWPDPRERSRYVKVKLGAPLVR